MSRRYLPAPPDFLKLVPILALAVLLSACGQASYSAEQHLERGWNFEQQGNLGGASIEYRNALQQDPGNAGGRFRLGMLLLRTGDSAGAEAELSRALELGWDRDELRLPMLKVDLQKGRYGRVLDATSLLDSFPIAQVPEALALRGQALFQNGDTDQARMAFSEALELDAQAAQPMLGLALLEFRVRQDNEEAYRWIEKVLESEPANAEALEFLGDIEQAAGRPLEAEKAYGLAIDAKPNPFSATLKRSLVRASLSDFEGAERDARALQRMNSSHPAPSYVRGVVAFTQERYSEAQGEFETVLARSNNFLATAYYLGASHFAQGNWRQAEAALARFVRSFPESDEGLRLLALARLNAGDPAGALAPLKTLVAQRPDDPGILQLISDTLRLQGQPKEAVQYMRRVAELQPHSPAARISVGMALLQQGQREEAFEDFSSAFALEPEGTGPLQAVIFMEHLQSGEFAEALAVAQQLATHHPREALPQSLIGLAYRALGETESAQGAFRNALEIDPALSLASQHLAAVLFENGDTDGAIEVLSKALDHQPENVHLLSGMAEIHLLSGHMEDAGVYLERVVAGRPAELGPRVALSRYHLEMAEPNKAMRTLRDVEGQHGDSPLWLRHMAEAQLAGGQMEAAIPTLEKLSESEPGDARVWYGLAQAYTDTSKTPNARIALERALQADPSHLRARLALVRFHTSTGQTDEARELLRPAQLEYPNDPRVLESSGIIAFQERRFDAAANQLAAALEDRPVSDEAVVAALAESQWRIGQQANAIETVERFLESAPRHHGMRIRLATMQMAAEDEAAAIDSFRHVLETHPSDLFALNNLAWLLRRDQSDEALDLASRAVRLAPDSGTAIGTLGAVQRARGDNAAALIHLRKAVEAEPGVVAFRLEFSHGLIAGGKPDEAREQLQIILRDHPEAAESTEAKALLDTL